MILPRGMPGSCKDTREPSTKEEERLRPVDDWASSIPQCSLWSNLAHLYHQKWQPKDSNARKQGPEMAECLYLLRDFTLQGLA